MANRIIWILYIYFGCYFYINRNSYLIDFKLWILAYYLTYQIRLVICSFRLLSISSLPWSASGLVCVCVWVCTFSVLIWFSHTTWQCVPKGTYGIASCKSDWAGSSQIYIYIDHPPAPQLGNSFCVVLDACGIYIYIYMWILSKFK